MAQTPIAPRGSKRSTKLVSLGVAVASLSAGVAAAGATGGGGVGPPDPPRVGDVRCVETCAGVRAATEGSRVELTGRHLANVETVSFDGHGEAQIPVEPTKVERRSVKAKVPVGARTGKPRVIDAYGSGSGSPHELEIVGEDEIGEAGPFELIEANARPDKAYFYGQHDPTVTYSFEGSEPTDVRIDVVKRESGRVVRAFTRRAREPFALNRASWDGRTQTGGEPGNGKYKFEIGPAAGGEAEATEGSRFEFYGHRFPIRGRHSYGDGVGAPRDGHTHQGQDVFAKCGTRLVAARGGEVQTKAYHSAAGYYVVIDGKKTDRDYVYMHLKDRARVREGSNVRTGERIGRVGDTGNASGCHLHFELWSGPGWYEGGSFLESVTRKLRKWDSWS